MTKDTRAESFSLTLWTLSIVIKYLKINIQTHLNNFKDKNFRLSTKQIPINRRFNINKTI